MPFALSNPQRLHLDVRETLWMPRAEPVIETITVSRVTALPSFHPESGPTFAAFPVHVFLIHHRDGPVLVDTGIGLGNDLIDDWYKPVTVDLRHELIIRGVDPDHPGLTVINTHLHFDHCGQNCLFPQARIVVQKSEAEIAATPHYTVDSWASLPPGRAVIVDGDVEIADGIEVMHTPGHTPGHQSVVVRSSSGTTIIGGQCVFRAAEWHDHAPSQANLHDPNHRLQAAESVAKLRALRPIRVLLSHDEPVTLRSARR